MQSRMLPNAEAEITRDRDAILFEWHPGIFTGLIFSEISKLWEEAVPQLQFLKCHQE